MKNFLKFSDNSQDNSPQELNDVVLQSAPQSPGSMNYSGSDRNQSYSSQYTYVLVNNLMPSKMI